MKKFNPLLPTVVITIDGSFDQLTEMGTAAFHVQSDYKLIAQAKVLGRVKASTQAELIGALEALKVVAKHFSIPCNIKLITDCAHVQRILTQIHDIHQRDYKKSKKSNATYAGEREDVMRAIYTLCQELNVYAVKRKPRNSTPELSWCDSAAHKLLNETNTLIGEAKLEPYRLSF